MSKNNGKEKVSNAPLGYGKTFGMQILMRLPVVGLIVSLLMLVIPKIGHNLKCVALGEFIFQLIGTGLFVAFFALGGIGYILEWIDVGLGLHLFGL